MTPPNILKNTENGMGDGIWFGIVPCDEPGGFRVT